MDGLVVRMSDEVPAEVVDRIKQKVMAEVHREKPVSELDRMRAMLQRARIPYEEVRSERSARSGRYTALVVGRTPADVHLLFTGAGALWNMWVEE